VVQLLVNIHTPPPQQEIGRSALHIEYELPARIVLLAAAAWSHVSVIHRTSYLRVRSRCCWSGSLLLRLRALNRMKDRGQLTADHASQSACAAVGAGDGLKLLANGLSRGRRVYDRDWF
jgi:hypothetical protein